eukprot:gene4-biopygen19536
MAVYGHTGWRPPVEPGSPVIPGTLWGWGLGSPACPRHARATPKPKNAYSPRHARASVLFPQQRKVPRQCPVPPTEEGPAPVSCSPNRGRSRAAAARASKA